MNFIIGRNNLAATIFVPWDCENNCAFCTSKIDYKILKSDYEKVKKSIETLNKLSVKEIVFTGGEPFSNLNALQELINLVSTDKKIYVNSILPIAKGSNKNEIISFINNSRIDSVNVSRHGVNIIEDLNLFNSNFLLDEDISKIKKHVKINCVICETSDIESIVNRWLGFKNLTLSLRADYRKINIGNLKTLDDQIMKNLLSIKDMKYISHGGCDVCFDVAFNYKNLDVRYHRGLENSSEIIGDTIIVNDIIVKQNGSISYDWDGRNYNISNMFDTFAKKTNKKGQPLKKSSSSSSSCGFGGSGSSSC